VAEVDPDDNEEAKVGTNDDRVKVIEGLGGLGVSEVSCIGVTSRGGKKKKKKKGGGNWSLPPGRSR
jgi:hypothetical protein